MGKAAITTMEWPMLKRLHPRSVPEPVRSAVGVTRSLIRAPVPETPWIFELLWRPQPVHPPSLG